MTFPFSSEGLVGADGAWRPQPARPRAGRCPAELGTQHRLPLAAGVGQCGPAQEHQLGGPPHRGSVLLAACAGGFIPHAGVPHPGPLPFHLFHDDVQWPTTQGGALLPRRGHRPLCPPGHFSVDQRRREPGVGAIWVPQSLLRAPEDFCALSQFSVFTDSCGVAVLSEVGFQDKPLCHPLLIDDGIYLWSTHHNPTETHHNVNSVCQG